MSEWFKRDVTALVGWCPHIQCRHFIRAWDTIYLTGREIYNLKTSILFLLFANKRGPVIGICMDGLVHV